MTAVARILVLLALFALCACGVGAAPPTVLVSRLSPSVVDGNHDTAPICHGQKTNSKYASVVEAISRKPTVLCVPYFKGFGGFIGFPAAHPPGKVTLMASDRPIHDGLPKLHGAAPICYLEWYPGWQMTFGKRAPAGGVFGKAFTSGHFYTAYGIGDRDGGTDRVGPCYSIAVEGTHGAVFRNLGSLLKGESDSVFTWTLGIYPGKEASVPCA